MKKILKYLKPYFLMVLLSFILSIICVVSKLYMPILIGKAIDLFIDNNVDFEVLFKLCKFMFILIVINFISQWLMNLINNNVTYKVCKDIRNDAFEKLMSLPFNYLDSHMVGETTNRIINDVDTFSDGLLLDFTNFFSSILTILLTIFFMFRINIKVSLIVLILTPLSLLAARVISKNTHDLFISQTKLKGLQASYIDEMVNNEKVVKAFNQKDKVNKEFDEINNDLSAISLKAVFFSSLSNPATRFVNAIVYAAISLFGAYSVMEGMLSVGSLSSFLSYASQYTKPFNEISDVFVELQNAIICGNRAFELIDEESIIENENARDIEVLDGDVQIDNIVFGYQKDHPILNKMSFVAYKGHKIAIVGSTGCGKTTLINLLMRFYDIDEGTIKIDGVDISEITRTSIRRNFGMVLQDSWLKEATIKENLKFGKKDATEEEIIEACKKCHIHNFIMRLENGYDTLISENDGQISAGQKQLLCIARIMIANPNVIVLDEATSAIDTRTEIKVQEAFDELTKNRTAFIVAHRLSTIRNADVILVMDKGKIIEQGKHEELLKLNGFYANLYNSQFNKENI